MTVPSSSSSFHTTSSPQPSYILYYDHLPCTPYSLFSHWSPTPFFDPLLPGLVFPTAEHYMMYHKSLLFCPSSCRDVMRSSDPAEAKKVGRGVKGFERRVWDRVADGVVERANWLRFGGGLDEGEIQRVYMEKEKKERREQGESGSGGGKETGDSTGSGEGSSSTQHFHPTDLPQTNADVSTSTSTSDSATDPDVVMNPHTMDIHDRLAFLLSTGTTPLVEASPEDRKWGIGFGVDVAAGNEEEWGENRAGKALMRARERLARSIEGLEKVERFQGVNGTREG